MITKRQGILPVLIIVLVSFIQSTVSVGEVPDYTISGVDQNAACKTISENHITNDATCVYQNVDYQLPNYPDDYPCPCQRGTQQGAFPGNGPKVEAFPYEGQFVDELMFSGFDDPKYPFTNLVGMAFTDNTRELFVAVKTGYVFHIDLETGKKTVFVDLIDETHNSGDKGLISIEVHSNFAQNRWVYLSVTVDPVFGQPDEDMNSVTFHRIIRLEASLDGKAVDNSRVILLGKTAADGIISCSSSHLGGALALGHDGSLFITVGDGALFDDAGGDYGQNQVCRNMFPVEQDIGSLRAQWLDSISGKVLRVNPIDGAPGICEGNPNFTEFNPFCRGNENEVRAKIWALGLRNPYSANVRPARDGETGPGLLFVGDVGFGSFEEVNIVRKADNMGWPCWEGPLPMPLFRDSPYDAITPANDKIVRATLDNGSTLNCNYVFKNVATDFPMFYWSRYSEGEGLINKDNGYLGQGFLGNCVGGVSFYTGSPNASNAYPDTYKDSVFVLDYGAAWVKVIKTNEQDKYVKIQDFVPIPSLAILSLERDPYTGNIWYLRQITGEIRQFRYQTSNTAPVPIVSATPSTGKAPLEVQFSSDGTMDRENEKLQWLWTFEDGKTSTVANPKFTFTTNGVHEVSLSVKDESGNEAVVKTTVKVDDNLPPKVQITSPTTSGNFFYYATMEDTVQFDCTVEDEDAASVTYNWEVQIVHNNHIHAESFITTDKQWSRTASVLGADHVTERANVRVVLTVTDNSGNKDQSHIWLTSQDWNTKYQNTPPKPLFEISGFEPHVTNQPVVFDAKETSDTELDYIFFSWDFGDGFTLSGSSNPSHSYLEAGEYTVLLNVSDNWATFQTLSKAITVKNDDGSTQNTNNTQSTTTSNNATTGNSGTTGNNATTGNSGTTGNGDTEGTREEDQEESSSALLVISGSMTLLALLSLFV